MCRLYIHISMFISKMSFPDSDSKPKFRVVYVENCYNISYNKPLFTGAFAHLDEIKERLADFIPSHQCLTIEYYNKKFGYCNRRLLDNELPSDLEDIYVYLRPKKQAVCNVCETPAIGATGDNHEYK